MKNIMILLLVLFVGNSYAQDQPKTKTITFLTSAVCGECKERIENKLNYTKGIIFAELDLETKNLTVKYKTSQLTEKDVKTIVSKIGYDAGDVKKNPDAFNELPKCCKSADHKGQHH